MITDHKIKAYICIYIAYITILAYFLPDGETDMSVSIFKV